MTSDIARIRLKYRELEVEYEGSQDFLNNGLIDLIRDAGDALSALPAPQVVHHATAIALPAPDGHQPSVADADQKIELGMGSVAAKLDAKAGPDLIIAAAAYLTIVRGESRLSRKNIATEMKNAPAYFKESMISNLSYYLQSLLKDGRLNEVAKDTYAIPAEELSSLRAKLA